MLTPSYIQQITDASAIMTSTLETRIKQMIIERMVARLDRGEDFYLTSTDMWNAEIYKDSGGLLQDVAQEVARFTPMQAYTVYQAFKDGMDKSWKYDTAIFRKVGIEESRLGQSPHYIRLMQRHYEDTINDLYNMTGTRAAAAQKLFIEECSKAYLYVTSGADGYSSAVVNAIEKAVANVSDKGVMIEYPSGHVDTLETATLRAVRTGVSQTTAAITDERMQEYDWDIVLVSSHYGARPSHAVWQGKFYSLFGKTPGYPLLADATGYGEVDGLCGANCRHSFGPGVPGYNPYDKVGQKENREIYEKVEKQRDIERRIRRSKGRLLEQQAAIDAAKSPELIEKLQRKYDRQAATLARQNKEYTKFCEEENFKRRPDRLHKGGFGRAEANKAAVSAKKYNKEKEDKA